MLDYPQCLATDMESTALAQTCFLNNIALYQLDVFLICKHSSADEEFYLELDTVTLRSAKFVLSLIGKNLDNLNIL